MRIEELLVENQQLDELGLNQIGQGLKKAAGAVGKGIVGAAKAAPGVVQGIGDVASAATGGIGQAVGAVGGGLMRGYNTARSGKGFNSTNQDNTNDPNATTDSNKTVGTNTTVGTAQGDQPATDAAQGNQPATDPAQAAKDAQQAKIGVGQINKIIPGLRTRDLQSIKANIDKRMQAMNKNPTGAAAPTNAQTATGTQPQGNQTLNKANTVANAPAAQPNVSKYSGQSNNITQGNPLAMAESVEFYSKFLGKNI